MWKHPFESEVNAVFPGNFLKRLDVAVRDFDVADPSPLPDKVFHTLFALVDLGIFLLFLHFLKGFSGVRLSDIGGQLGGFDANRHRFVFNFFLHNLITPFSGRNAEKRKWSKAEPPAGATETVSAGTGHQASALHLVFSLSMDFQNAIRVVAVMPSRCATAISFLRTRQLRPRRQSAHGSGAEVHAHVNAVLVFGRNGITQEMGKIENRTDWGKTGFIDFAAVHRRLINDSKLAAFPDGCNVGKWLFHGEAPFSGCAG